MTLVEPYLRYGNIIWGQSGNTLIEKVQRLQNKAARIISGTSFEETNHDDLLRELTWMNVKQLISHDLAVAMFTLRNGLSPSQCTENLQTISEIHGCQTRSVTSKVCRISYQRPVNYLCDAWHVFPPKYEGWTHFNRP